jgi:N-acetyl-1-D-myo-inositol-2-amino-2-deoxy-alpha-D-glucopyranoside deacetylase
VLDEVRPHAVVTYDERGLYGHPDHIHTHLATLRALDARPGVRLFYAVVSREGLLEARAAFLATGAAPEDDGILSEENIDFVGTPDERITVRFDASACVDRKIAALRAHRTQWGTTERFLDQPAPVRDLMLGTEYFVLARPRDGMPPSGDLFAGLDE